MTAPDFAVDRLTLAVEAVLAAVVDAAGDLGVTIPGRQLTSVGSIPYDCPQVAVYATQITTGAPESRSGVGTYPNHGANVTLYQVSMVIAIVRDTQEIPTGAHGTVAPAPATYLSNLTQASGDAAVLIRAANALAEGDIGVGASTRQVTLAAPSGAVIATSIRMNLSV